jgi:tetratricopeptide (TPR) repeat protein
LNQYEPAIADLEAALLRQPDDREIAETLSRCCNNRAWELATGSGSRDPQRALALAQRAVALDSRGIYLNTLGVAQYRAGHDADAIATLQRSLKASGDQTDAFDLYFLALAHHRLGHDADARACLDRAVRWQQQHPNLPGNYPQELAAFRAEAEAALAQPILNLPDDLFAP